MYKEIAKLILYRDLGEDSILLKLGGIFEDFDDHVVLLLWFSVCDRPVNDGREDVERRIEQRKGRLLPNSDRAKALIEPQVLGRVQGREVHDIAIGIAFCHGTHVS